jgi:serine/threonine-protein kinase
MENTHIDPARPTAPQGPPLPASQPPPPVSPGGAAKDRAPANADPLHDIRILGEYRILRRLGEGGMGAVYLGYNGRDDRQVAIKVLSERLTSNQSYIDRFYREAKSGALLSHPNIVRTLAAGQDRATGKHYMVLEFVDGLSAHALLDRLGPLSVGDVVHIALDVARALEHAHSRNIVHRDIKPDNILLTRSGVAKLVDLGLAKRIDEPSHLTAARQGFGTTPYMPYEQAVDAKYADGRCDIYALGATLYHLVTGKVPFPGDNHLDIVEKKNQGQFPPASSLNPAVPPVLDHILARMLARQPRDRYQTASELIIDLERSRLAAPVPSFADPQRAREDPWIQAFQSSAEPTRLDPDAPPRAAPTNLAPGAPADGWLVRYASRGGRGVTVRATVPEIIERLKSGKFPADAEGQQPGQDDFRPLSSFPEFAGVPLPPAPKAKAPAPNADAEEAAAPSRPWLAVLLLVAAVLVAFGLLALVRWLTRS